MTADQIPDYSSLRLLTELVLLDTDDESGLTEQMIRRAVACARRDGGRGRGRGDEHRGTNVRRDPTSCS